MILIVIIYFAVKFTTVRPPILFSGLELSLRVSNFVSILQTSCNSLFLSEQNYTQHNHICISSSTKPLSYLSHIIEVWEYFCINSNLNELRAMKFVTIFAPIKRD